MGRSVGFNMEHMLQTSLIADKQDRSFRFKIGGVCIVLLALLASALGLLSPTGATNAPLNRGRDAGARAASEYLARGQASSPSGSLHEILAHADIIASHAHPLLGQRAPDFELADPNGKLWNLKELQDGGSVVLIFYYGYHCPLCVRQLFDVNKDLPLFREIGARVIAIGADPPELTRDRFQEFGAFDFPILSDPGNKVAQDYKMFKRHGTFIIDRQGVVQWVNVGDAPLRRNPAVLHQLEALSEK